MPATIYPPPPPNVSKSASSILNLNPHYPVLIIPVLRVHMPGRVDEEADYLLAGLDVAALEAGGHLVHALPEDVAVQGAHGGQMGLGLATQETN